jgi:hypothetical protein
MGAREGPFGRCGWSVGEELLDLEAEVRERFVEHAQEANDVVATVGLAAWRDQLGIGGPRLSVVIVSVDGGDVLQDHVFGVGHQLSGYLAARVSQITDCRVGRKAGASLWVRS